MKIGKYEFDLLHKGYIMGILNVTPDSFSDGGKFQSVDLALKQAERMINEGAAILDIGGESTRPGHKKITDQEEIERVVPVIEAIKKNFDIAISLDTYKYEVSKAGIAAGADMINDIWGLKWDERLAPLLAKEDVACCLMHNRDNHEYKDFIEDFCSDIEETLAIAKKAGIKEERIVLDPGVGFGKNFGTESFYYEAYGRFFKMGASDSSGHFEKVCDRSCFGFTGRSKRRRNCCNNGSWKNERCFYFSCT